MQIVVPRLEDAFNFYLIYIFKTRSYCSFYNLTPRNN